MLLCKSDILFQSIDVSIKDEETQTEYDFYFDVGQLEGKQSNEKGKLSMITVQEWKDSITTREAMRKPGQFMCLMLCIPAELLKLTVL